MCDAPAILTVELDSETSLDQLPPLLRQHAYEGDDGHVVIVASKFARTYADPARFVPLTARGGSYGPVAQAVCAVTNGAHPAPLARCRCGFHALADSQSLGFSFRPGEVVELTVALSGTIVVGNWWEGLLFRAERQIVLGVDGVPYDEWAASPLETRVRRPEPETFWNRPDFGGRLVSRMPRPSTGAPAVALRIPAPSEWEVVSVADCDAVAPATNVRSRAVPERRALEYLS